MLKKKNKTKQKQKTLPPNQSHLLKHAEHAKGPFSVAPIFIIC
jgi:hypothetical protein